MFKDSVAVPGQGPAPCGLMVVGEAPGRDETRLKSPFAGKAGAFFVSILEKTLKVARTEVRISNAVKVWPVIRTKRLKTRPPSKEELAFFLPYLKEEIEIVDPKVIIAVGKTAFHALAPGHPFKPGEFVSAAGRLIMPVYHPAYILRKQKSLKENTEGLKAALGKVKRSIS